MLKDKSVHLIWLAMQLETNLETVEAKLEKQYTLEQSLEHKLLCDELERINKEIQLNADKALAA